MSPFGAAVREARDRRGKTEGREISQVEVGLLVGVTGATISRIESGERDPSFELGMRIAAALDIDLNLLKREVRPPSSSIAETTESERGAA